MKRPADSPFDAFLTGVALAFVLLVLMTAAAQIAYVAGWRP